MGVQGFVRLGALLIALVCSMPAQADGKRYLVKFKSAKTYATVARTVQSQNRVAPGVMAPVRLMGSNAIVGQTLDHVQLLVIESSDEKAVASLKSHPAVELVEEEIFHPAPKPMVTWRTQPFITQDLASAGDSPAFSRPWGIDACKGAPGLGRDTRGERASAGPRYRSRQRSSRNRSQF